MHNKLEGSADLDGLMRRIQALMLIGIVIIVGPFVLVSGYFQWRQTSQTRVLEYQDASAISAAEAVTLPEAPLCGQTLYVPAYSHIYHKEGQAVLLTITLSLRNTDLEKGIVLKSVRYFDSDGAEQKTLLAQPVALGPMASTRFVIERADKVGGAGASFLVEWLSADQVSNPVVEAIMLDTADGQGISFVCEAKVLSQLQ